VYKPMPTSASNQMPSPLKLSGKGSMACASPRDILSRDTSGAREEPISLALEKTRLIAKR
jgi:hypothetical protein